MIRHGFLCACLFGIPAFAGAADEPGAVRGRVLDSWALADGMVKSIRVVERREWYRAQAGQPLELRSTETLRFYLAQDRRLSEGARIDTDGKTDYPTEREFANNHYSANVRRQRTNGGWALAGHKPEGAGMPTFRRNIVLPWTKLANVQFTDWLADPLVRLDRAERPGGSVVRLHFTLTESPDRKPLNDRLRSGYLDFDESRFHCLVGYHITWKTAFSEGTETCTCTYAAGADIPVLEKAVIESPDIRSQRFGNSASREVRVYEVEYNRELPEDEFWLSHYGLPEPIGVVRERRTPRYVWFLVAAGLFAVVGVLLRRVIRRRSPPGVPA